jgi:6-phosphogluconolactonase (cycloisomerase 2 family)
MRVKFEPTAPGLRTATVTVASDAVGSPQTVMLTGNGLQGELTITPTPLTFPATPVGGTSPQRTLTLTNTGNAPVTFGGNQLTNIGEFHLVSGPCTVPEVLPGGSCQLFFTFTPQAQGLSTATFTISSDGFGSPQAVTLTGNGLAPALVVSASTNFPDTPVGGTSPVQTVTFHNGGTAPEHTTGTTLTGANPGDFRVVNNSCFPAPPLAPGSDCTVSLTFSPAAAVARNAFLTVTGDSSAATTLSGNGLGPAKALTITPNPVIFPDTPVGGPPGFSIVRIHNSGSVTVNISSTTITGPNAADFAGLEPPIFCNGPLPPGADCIVGFLFNPKAVGPRMATFTVTSDATPGTVAATFSGNGIAATKILTLTPNPPSPVNFPDTVVGATSAMQTLTATNTGNSDVTFTGPVPLGGANPGDFSYNIAGSSCLGNGFNPVVVFHPGQSCNVQFAFTPTAAGARTATFLLRDDATGNPQTVTLTGNGIAATKILTLAPSDQLKFPDTLVGNHSVAQSVTVTNAGNAPVQVTGTTFGGPNVSDFQVQPFFCGGPPGTVPPGGSCLIVVIFAPSAPGLRTATATVTSDATGSPQTVTLTGNGSSTSLILIPNPPVFPDTPVGHLSPQQTLTVTNIGHTDVQIGATSLGGPNANLSDFQITTNTCVTPTPALLAPGANCTVGVTFNPQAAGPRTATLIIVSDGIGSPQKVALNGRGIPGALSLTPNPLSFAPTPVGRLSAPQTLTITNNGPAVVRFNGFTLGGANAVDFQIATNRCITPTSGAISPNASCTIDFTFNPQAAGARMATLTIASDGAGSPQTVNLTGNGIPGQLTLTPNPPIFPDTPVGRLSTPQTLTITNTGPATVRFSGISVGGANAVDFQITTNLCQTPTSASLSANASCTLSFTFNPQAAGARMATLTITSDGAGSPQTVTLTGNGIAGQLKLTPNPLNFPDTAVGMPSAAQTLTVTNTGPALVRFSAISLGGTNAVDFQITTNQCQTPTSGALSANASCTLSLTFNPRAAGARNATLTIASDGVGSPQTVNLTGNGITQKVLTLTPNPLNFPDTAVGSISVPQVITVTSTGGSAVDISSVAVTGGNPGDFTITGTTCPLPPATLSGACTVSVAFAPTATGARSASFTITSDGVGSPQSVTLTGNGTVPPTVPRFAYEANSDGTVSIFAVNPATGHLQARGYATVPLTGTAATPALALDPQNRFVFYGIANSASQSSSIFTFLADSATGSLTLQPDSITTSGTVSAAVVDPSGRFLYVGGGSSSGGQVSAYSINSTTGALTQITGSPFTTGGSPRIAIDPLGKFLYTGDSSGVSAFTIDSVTGALTPVAGSPFAPGVPTPDAITVDPQGKFVYFLSNSSVFGFAINGTSGVLTAVPGSPFAPVAPNLVTMSIAIDPTSSFMYVTNFSQVQGTSSISAYRLDATTGALTPLTGSPFSSGLAEPSWISVDPSGAFLYVPSFDTTAGGIIEAFTIAPGTGVLSSLGSTSARLFPHAPVQLAISSGTAAVTSRPAYVLVANSGSNDVSAYSVNPASGTLTAVSGSPFLAGTSPVSVSTDILGRFAYVANNGSNDISAFDVSPATGALIPVTGSPFPTGGTGPQSVVVDGPSEFVYAGNSGSQNISEFSLNPATGALSAISGSPLGASFSVTALSDDPTGQLVFAVGTGIANFALGNFYDVNVNGNPKSTNPNGSLSLANTLTTGSELKASSVAVHPSGRFAYVTNMGSNSVTGVSLTCCQSAPVPGSPFPTGTSPVSVAIEPLGRFLYVANSGSNNISAYSIDPSTGTASPLAGPPFPAGTNPSALAVDGSGKFLFVTNKGDNTVSVFSIDSSTGMLTAVAGSPFGSGTAPAAITVINKLQ